MALDDRSWHLVADVGGTNARFALTDPSAPDVRLVEPQALPGAEFAGLGDAARHYLDRVGVAPSRAAFAVACSIGDGDAVALTNRAWSFSRRALERELGLAHLRLLNDFGAVAWALPALGAGDRIVLHGDPDAPLAGPVTVIGPGTGLGVGLLVDTPHGWHAVETEGGHVTFAPVDDAERAIARRLDAAFGRTSTERLLSGPGLSHIAAVLSDDAPGAPPREPAEIVAAALDGGDAVARRSLDVFCAALGSVAGDAALLHGARTVAIAGGIVPRFVPFLAASAFRARFVAKGRFAGLMERVAVQVVTHPHPGLLGAAVALRSSPVGAA